MNAPPRLHPAPADIDHHLMDSALAGYVRTDDPFCRCRVNYGGMFTCRACGRMRREAAVAVTNLADQLTPAENNRKRNP